MMYLGSSFSTSFLKPYFATPCNHISKLHPFLTLGVQLQVSFQLCNNCVIITTLLLNCSQFQTCVRLSCVISGYH